MKEVELLLAIEKFRDSEPILYGVLLGLIIAAPFIVLGCAFSYLYGFQKSKRNEKAKSAVDLIGKTVTYKKDSLSFDGIVVSVDFDLGDNDNLGATIYIETDWLTNYYKVDYKEFGKTLFEKGGAE